MITGHVFIAASLDGFIARADDGLDWLEKQRTEGEDHGYDRFISSVDGLVMGSGTYRKVLSFSSWPYPKPVVVMSQSIGAAEVPDELRGKVTISTLPPKALFADLAEQGWTRAYVDGGKVIQSFLREGLIADMIITRIPILLGDGIPLFGPLERDVDLELLAANSFGSGLQQTHYRVV